MDTLAEALARSPELFPQALDMGAGTVTLLRLSRADYKEASFLDERLASPAKASRIMAFPALAQAVDAAGLPETCHFIFHIGHVGSTLLSRLLGKHPALFSLREPQILRTLAQAQNGTSADAHLPVFLKLWSRTFDPGDRALVKATSFVSEIAAAILARDYAPRALIVGVSPETYLATIWGGANAPAEARALAPFRLARLQRRWGCNWRLADFDQGEKIALGWACEASALAEAAQQAPARVHTIDFERFLSDPETTLARTFAHFGVDAGAQQIAGILAGPEMRTYSKAPEFNYDAGVRRSVLAEGRARHAADIHDGLRWLDRAAHDFPQLESALALFA